MNLHARLDEWVQITFGKQQVPWCFHDILRTPTMTRTRTLPSFVNTGEDRYLALIGLYPDTSKWISYALPASSERK